nr:unnamed protein product [Triticum aestivum]
MGRGCHALTTFVQPTGQKLDHAEPLVSRHGLLLVRLPSHGSRVVHLAVCNLLVGECHVLPPLKCGKVDPLHLDWSGYAILSGVDSCSYNQQPPPSNDASSFKVVIIDLDYNLYTFASDKGSWSTASRCFGDEATSNYTAVYHGPAVVCRGTAHWLFYEGMMPGLCIVGMEAKTGHITLTRIPFEMDDMRYRPCLTLSTDGTLSLIYIEREDARVLIWEILDETTNCLCTRSIELQEPGKKLTQSISSLHMLGEKYGTMIAQGSSLCVYVVDLETETVEELLDWPNRHANRVDVVPLQMSWLTFFLSRLGSR